MANKILTDLRKRIVSFAQDDDTALSVSDLNEYYLDSGALFNIIVCNAIELTQDDTIEVEFFADDATVRVFNYFISTLSDEYSLFFYELNERDLAAGWTEGEDEDYLEAVVTKLNRVKLENDLPIDIAFLQDGTGGGDGDGQKYDIECWEAGTYSADEYVRHKGIVYQVKNDVEGGSTDDEPPSNDWDEVGNVITGEHLRMEGAGGPQAADMGATVDRSTIIRFNTKQKNYLLEIKNIDTTTREFGLNVLLGVSEFLMHN